MKYLVLILWCVGAAYLLRKLLGIAFGPALQTNRLLEQYPHAEQTSVFLPALPMSVWHLWREPRQICARIEEMRQQGWTYLRSSRVRDGRLTLGGVTLHFIRTDVCRTERAT